MAIVWIASVLCVWSLDMLTNNPHRGLLCNSRVVGVEVAMASRWREKLGYKGAAECGLNGSLTMGRSQRLIMVRLRMRC